MLPRSKSSLVLSSLTCWKADGVCRCPWNMVQYRVSSGGQCWQQWCSFCTVLIQHLSTDAVVAKRGFPLLTSQSPISGQSSDLFLSCEYLGGGKNLERHFQWEMAKITDKKTTVLAGLTFNSMNWPPRGEWGISGQCISGAPMGPTTSDLVWLFWASSCESGP